MGFEVGGRAAMERLSGPPQSFLTATRGEAREKELERDRDRSAVSFSRGFWRNGLLLLPFQGAFIAVFVLVPVWSTEFRNL